MDKKIKKKSSVAGKSAMKGTGAIAVYAVFIVVFALLAYNLTRKNAYVVTVGETKVCNVSKNLAEEELKEELIAAAESYAANAAKATVLLNETLTLTEIHSAQKDILPIETAIPQIAEVFTYQIEAVQILVNGRPVTLVKSRAEADEILKNISEEQSGEPAAEFEQEVNFVTKYAAPEEIDSFETAKTSLTVPTSGNVVYDVESGDTLSEIALRCNMTLGELLALNDGLDPAAPIKVGQPILIKKDAPLLSVKIPEAQSAMKTLGDD
jgi:LysM repeat protein